MNNIEILRKAIQKAEKNGFDNRNITCFDTHDIPARLYVRFLMCEDFAKAFWGENWVDRNGKVIDKAFVGRYLWQYHLQQMVLEEEPLKYLEKFLEN